MKQVIAQMLDKAVSQAVLALAFVILTQPAHLRLAIH